jgi:hypothetical protein
MQARPSAAGCFGPDPASAYDSHVPTTGPPSDEGRPTAPYGTLGSSFSVLTAGQAYTAALIVEACASEDTELTRSIRHLGQTSLHYEVLDEKTELLPEPNDLANGNTAR